MNTVSIRSQVIQHLTLQCIVVNKANLVIYSERTLTHLAMFIVMFLQAMVQFLVKSSNDGALEAHVCDFTSAWDGVS